MLVQNQKKNFKIKKKSQNELRIWKKKFVFSVHFGNFFSFQKKKKLICTYIGTVDYKTVKKITNGIPMVDAVSMLITLGHFRTFYEKSEGNFFVKQYTIGFF